MSPSGRQCKEKTENRGETVVVFASPRRFGNTGRLLDAFLKKNGVGEYFFFDCFKAMPLPCDDCGYCKTVFGCSKPDLSEFFEHFDRCGRVVIASPVYNGGFPAPLKALIDRSQVYYNARFLRGERRDTPKKKAAVLLTAGSENAGTSGMIETLKRVFSVTSCELVSSFVLSGTDGAEPTDYENELPEI